MGNAYQPRRTIIATAFTLTVLAACGGTPDTTDSSNENPSVATSGNDAPNGSVNDSDNPAPENAVEPLACATDSFDLDHGNQLFRFIFLYDDKRRLITTETTRVADNYTWLSKNSVYRADDRASETWEFSDTEVLLSRSESTYTAAGALKTKRNFDASNTLNSTEDLSYNGDDYLIEHRIDYIQIDASSTVTYEYDALSRLTKAISEGLMGTTTTLYTYDDNDRLIRYEISSHNATSTYEMAYALDSQGRIIESRVIEAEALISRTKFKFIGPLLAAVESYQGQDTLVSRTYYLCDGLPSL